MRPSSAFALFFAVCAGWWRELAGAALVNVTVDDTDPSILYKPRASWHPSSIPCSFCLEPSSSIAFNGTWHDGLHIIPTSDNDDKTAKVPVADNPFHVGKLDDDDPGFVDKHVTAQLQFTGSAVYLYCIQPLHVAPVNTTPTNMNLTFTLDGHVADVYTHNGSKSASGFSPHINVFSRDGLSETPHLLQVSVGPDSVFLFDYMKYTQTVQDNTTMTATTATTATAFPIPQSETETVKRHDTGTFAGAVGGSVGVLTIFALGLAFNLYRRRVLAARRDRRDRRQNEANTEESQPMHGPAPFIPRYFPGTVPTAPPPYVPSSHSETSSSGTVPYVPLRQHPNYADLPPSTPPPLDDGLTVSVPPPPFGAEVATPVAVLPDGLPPGATNITPPPLPPDAGSEDVRQ